MLDSYHNLLLFWRILTILTKHLGVLNHFNKLQLSQAKFVNLSGNKCPGDIFPGELFPKRILSWSQLGLMWSYLFIPSHTFIDKTTNIWPLHIAEIICFNAVFHYSSKCVRSSVRIRKKVSLTTRCPHELIIAALNPSPGPADQPTPSTSSAASSVLTNPVKALCTCCKTSFDVTTGGKCPHCKTKVQYCSRRCQVKCFILGTHSWLEGPALISATNG